MIKILQTGKKGLSRRDFVKKSSLATIGGLYLSSLPAGASANVLGNDTIKVALIGCGGRGTGAAHQALSTGRDVKLVAMADVFEDMLENSYEALAQRYLDTGQLDVPDEHKFVGFDAYKHATELADVVLLATTPAFRPEHFEEAVRQGKHVFMEKPLATDAPGVRSIMETGKIAEQKGLTVVAGLQRRYDFAYREVKKRLEQNMIGEPIAAQVYYHRPNVWSRERRPEYSELEFQMRNWYYFTWLSGDHNVEQHIHSIDAANYLLGEHPIQAQGMGGREVRTSPAFGQIFDHHFVEYTYPSGLVMASQSRHIPGCWNVSKERILGSDGSTLTDHGYGAGSEGTVKNRRGDIHYEHDDSEDPNPYQQEITELFDSLRNGYVINDTESAAQSTMSAIMGRMATYSGQVIEWEDAIANDHRLVPEKLSWDMEPPVSPGDDGTYPVAIPGQTPPY